MGSKRVLNDQQIERIAELVAEKVIERLEGARPQHNGGAFERAHAVAARTGLTVPTIYKMMNAGRFPKPVRLSERNVAWMKSEIDKWIAARAAEPYVPSGALARPRMETPTRRGETRRGYELENGANVLNDTPNSTRGQQQPLRGQHRFNRAVGPMARLQAAQIPRNSAGPEIFDDAPLGARQKGQDV